MKLKNFAFAIIAMAMGACSNEDETLTNNGIAEGGDAFISLSIALPDATNTKAMDPGTEGEEEGTTDENTVKSILVLLYDNSGTLKDSKEFPIAELTYSGDVYTTKKWQVKTGEYKAVAIVNPLAAYTATGNTITATLTTLNAVRYESASGLKDNGFIMTNALTTSSPATPANNGDFYADGSVYVNVNGTSMNPTELTINVERSLAKVMITTPATDMSVTADANAAIEFIAFKEVTLNKSYFPIKKLTANGINTTNDYIVDPNFDNNTPNNAAANFSNLDIRNGYKAFSNGTFYCLENTMTAAQQQLGNSTAIYFKARYYADKNDKTAKHLYKYLGKVYDSFTALRSAGVNLTGITEKTYVKGSANSNYSYTEAQTLAEKGVTVYNGGICYYPYKIRHVKSSANNDIMEFAVVRNNVYKLSINSVAGIGKGTYEDITAPKDQEGTDSSTDPKDPDKNTTIDPDQPIDPADPNFPTDPSDPTTPGYDPANPGKPGVTPSTDANTEMDDTDPVLNVSVRILKWTIRKDAIDM
ncbi:Mfa1 family fimbria major subunit [Bacteroides helcogenes]|uniref:Fimbrial subunit protein C-terminal domain-containing protein n=1 Tax=Bacteroides helcogenes (strain ATCC 35417 / DSM 20613 / JCM 6297 / CCUG 15421 / P 36-108) TaxID=693979 RepID=E6SNE9_BACT6|nr:Mfa1 family fimbria major subunit [Bacteroides helcogenes]ADV42742.1 hypothetical protein Bache_0719 [Bacteroides helcogenes P 36-108]MDY5239573.1 Mfa1 family fimbria major subunit [Bacteroides helcogenes]